MNPFKNINKKLYYGLADNLRNDDNRLEKYYKQYLDQGFDDTETWNLDFTIVKFVLPRLKRFKEISQSHPVYLTSDEWENNLNKMISAMEIYINEDLFLNRTEQQALLDEGMKLFHEHFTQLWW